jgi:hypothetical protein
MTYPFKDISRIDLLKVFMLIANVLIVTSLLLSLSYWGEESTKPRLVAFLVGVMIGHISVKSMTLLLTIAAMYLTPMKTIVDRMANITSLFGFLVATLLFVSQEETQVVLYGFGTYMLLNLYSTISRLMRWSILTHFGYETDQEETMPPKEGYSVN